jgi:mono/diheme cytochrome c family protein
MKFAIAILGIAIVLFGISVSVAQHSEAKPTKIKVWEDSVSKAPEKYRVRQNPLVGDTSSIPAGKLLFEEHCSECHGHDALGMRRAPSLFRDNVQSAPPGAIFWVMTNGVVRHGMPAWSKLPEPERWQIISYLKSLGASSGKPDEPTTPGR